MSKRYRIGQRASREERTARAEHHGNKIDDHLIDEAKPQCLTADLASRHVDDTVAGIHLGGSDVRLASLAVSGEGDRVAPWWSPPQPGHGPYDGLLGGRRVLVVRYQRSARRGGRLGPAECSG